MSQWRPSAGRDALQLRAAFNRMARGFFQARDVLEVETPVMSLAGNTEPNIASFALEFSGRTDGAPRTRWLRTSPEFALKRLLASGIGDCYELGRVFRDGEAGGRHNPEFTMLEWYRIGWDHLRLLDETVGLVRAALALVGRDAGLGLYYWLGLGVALALVAYEFAIARCRRPEWCFRAFLHNNWVGLAIFAGIAADYALRARVVEA